MLIILIFHRLCNFFRYKENSKLRSEIYRDQYMKPLDRAVYWVEYVLRHNGTNFLKISSPTQNYIQYFSIDFSFVVISVIIVSIFLFVKMIKCIVKTKNVNLTKKTN